MKENEKYFINGLFMAISIGYFIYLNTVGVPDDIIILMKYGGLYLDAFNKGEYWRLVVSMFMHVSMGHILCNMINQYLIGERLERALGKIKFFIFYMICGIGANLVCMKLEMNEVAREAVKHMTISVGASGAICGLAGGLLYVTQANKGKYYEVTSYQVLLSVIFWVGFGLLSKNVNNDAHVSGFIIGYLLGVILYRRPKTLEDIERNQNMELKLIEDSNEGSEDDWEDLK